MATSANNLTEVARIAGALWGVKVGQDNTAAILAAADAQGLAKVVDEAYSGAFGRVPHAAIAATVAYNLRITGVGLADVLAAVKYTLDTASPGHEGTALLALLDRYSAMTPDPIYGAFATDYNRWVAEAVAYSQTPGTSTYGVFGPDRFLGLDQWFTTGVDTVTGSSGDDAFHAGMTGVQSNLSSGDTVNGGSGHDRLQAVMAAELTGQVSPITTSVETFSVHAVDITASGTGRADVDAARMSGLTRIESNASGADVVVEGVHVEGHQTSADITVAMVQTDPGPVDMAVYFDPSALREARPPFGSTLSLQLMDTYSAAIDPSKPLAGCPFNGIRFSLAGVSYTLQDAADFGGPIESAQTYDALLLAIQHALASNPGLAHVTASIIGSFDAFDVRTGRLLADVGKVIALTNSGPEAFSLGVWLAAGGVPASAELHTWMEAEPPLVTRITSTVVLDDVGRGAIGGDLIVGSLPSTDANAPKGVERFEITVERSSSLAVITSTGDALKEVQLVNGSTKGSFSAMGVSTPAGQAPSPTQDIPQGVSAEVHGKFGFTNVRVIDATAMTGAVAFSAQVTPDALAKYIGQAGSATGDAFGAVEFAYSGGMGNDQMSVVMDGGVVGSLGHVPRDVLDFQFHLQGGDGDDRIDLHILDHSAQPGAPEWYGQQALNRNLHIDGGTGNDTVRVAGAGDKLIDLGAGNDELHEDSGGIADNRITGGEGDDLIVLSTTDGERDQVSSNDTLVFNPFFGRDTILHFTSSAAVGRHGDDRIDLTGLGGRAAAGVLNAMDTPGAKVQGEAMEARISIDDLDNSATGNDNVDKVQRLFQDRGWGNADTTQLYLVVDAHNVSWIYRIIDAAGGSNFMPNISATLMGTIDLADTPWSSLGAADFA